MKNYLHRFGQEKFQKCEKNSVVQLRQFPQTVSLCYGLGAQVLNRKALIDYLEIG